MCAPEWTNFYDGESWWPLRAIQSNAVLAMWSRAGAWAMVSQG
jgi:hypothetical protein